MPSQRRQAHCSAEDQLLPVHGVALYVGARRVARVSLCRGAVCVLATKVSVFASATAWGEWHSLDGASNWAPAANVQAEAG